MILRILAVYFGSLAVPLAVSAQGATADPLTPRPNHERLAVFEGSWRQVGNGAEQPTESCSWLAGGRRHMICSARHIASAGPIEHRTIYSYRGRDSTYVVTALLATGQVWTYHGRPEGNKWVFNLQPDRPETTQRLRMVLTVAADTIHFVEESSENGGPFQITEDYRHVRIRSR
jgi:hypothetical protein